MAVVLALGTSVCYGLANYLGPLLAREWALGATLLVGQLAALACTLVLVLGSGEPAPDLHHLLVALLAGMGNALALAGLYRAAELGPISIAAPIGATGAVLPVVWGLAHGDPLSVLEAAGLVLALGGVILAARAPRAWEPDPAHDLRASIAFALAGAVGVGIFLIALPDASAGGRWWALFDARVSLVLCVVVLVLPRTVRRRPTLAALPALALPGILLLAGTLLYVLAAERGQLAVVSVLASLNPVVTVALAFFLLRERVSRTQSLGVAAALAGVVLIAS